MIHLNAIPLTGIDLTGQMTFVWWAAASAVALGFMGLFFLLATQPPLASGAGVHPRQVVVPRLRTPNTEPTVAARAA